jgi:CheY-like chemotaxis protein
VAPCRILLVEDNPSNRFLMQDALEAEGHQILIAENGKEGVERARAERPDIILMDIKMPVMNGDEATRRIRQIPEIADTPIIALTASVDEGTIAQCKEAGCDAHVGKPVDWETFPKVLKRFLKQR